MFAYSVRCSFETMPARDAFIVWLRERHVADVIAAGADDAELVVIDCALAVEMHYRFATRAAFALYEADHAPRLRADGLLTEDVEVRDGINIYVASYIAWPVLTDRLVKFLVTPFSTPDGVRFTLTWVLIDSSQGRYAMVLEGRCEATGSHDYVALWTRQGTSEPVIMCAPTHLPIVENLLRNAAMDEKRAS